MSAPKFKTGQLIKWKQKRHKLLLGNCLSGSTRSSMPRDGVWSTGLILKEQKGDPNAWGFFMYVSGSGFLYEYDNTSGFMVRDLKNKRNIFVELTNKNLYKVEIIK